MPRPIHLLIKPASGNCNLRCAYCFYADITEKRETPSFGMMSEETLEAVGFYATAPDTEYEVYVFDGDSFREHVENGVKFQVDSGKVLAFGMVTDAGFYTVRLAKPQTVNAGEPFAVAVKIHTPGTTQPVAVEYAGSGRTGNVDISDGEGYISFDGGTWERTEESKGCNVCLKAYSRIIGK